LSIYNQRPLDAIAKSLNTRPRKTLGFMTPCEAFAEAVAATPESTPVRGWVMASERAMPRSNLPRRAAQDDRDWACNARICRKASGPAGRGRQGCLPRHDRPRRAQPNLLVGGVATLLGLALDDLEELPGRRYANQEMEGSDDAVSSVIARWHAFSALASACLKASWMTSMFRSARATRARRSRRPVASRAAPAMTS